MPLSNRHPSSGLFLVSDTINSLVVYEYIAKSEADVAPALKALVTKPSSDLVQVGVRGFNRTLLIAGLSNGQVAVLKWDSGEIDYSLDVRPLQSSAPHEIDRFRCIRLVQSWKSSLIPVRIRSYPAVSVRLIVCGVTRRWDCALVDLIIRIWRVFPYAMESLAVTRSIFCAIPPIHLAIMRNSLAVAFRDEATMTHSMMLYNLDNNGKHRELNVASAERTMMC